MIIISLTKNKQARVRYVPPHTTVSNGNSRAARVFGQPSPLVVGGYSQPGQLKVVETYIF